MQTIFEPQPAQRDQRALDALTKAIATVLATQPTVTIGLPGGRSVIGLWQMLATADQLPWSQIHLFMVDERLVSLEGSDSNFAQAKKLFINQLIGEKKLPAKNVHPFNFQKEKIADSLIAYTDELKQFGGKYDILVVAAGEDGHVAGLFPRHHSIADDGKYFISFDDSPKPPAGRMTATRTLLSRAQQAVLFFTGEAKLNAYKNFLNPATTVADCPAKLIGQIANCTVVTDLQC